MIDFSQIPLFALADQRLAWVDNRQQVLAQNIANADTPRWHARDLAPFSQHLRQAGLTMLRTDPGHLGGLGGGAALRTQIDAGEQSPDGNSVSIDKELMKVADTDTTHALVTSLMQAYTGMFKTTIGK